ncbi:MAG: lysophospholipid acyltransferase family protein [Verrucomicrobiota bacterium]
MLLYESKSAWRQALLAAYLRRKFRQRFYSVRVSGFDGWQDWLEREDSYPLVLFGNHQTWWDGLLDFMLTRHHQMDSRLMMEAKNLRKFPFFQKCGVFGVDLDSARSRAEGLLHACRLLDGESSRRCLIIYPHGRLIPQWEKTPELQPGLAKILERVPQANAIPVFRQFTFGKHELPEVEIHIGTPLVRDDPRGTKELNDALHFAKEALNSRLSGNLDGFVHFLSHPVNRLRGET